MVYFSSSFILLLPFSISIKRSLWKKPSSFCWVISLEWIPLNRITGSRWPISFILSAYLHCFPTCQLLLPFYLIEDWAICSWQLLKYFHNTYSILTFFSGSINHAQFFVFNEISEWIKLIFQVWANAAFLQMETTRPAEHSKVLQSIYFCSGSQRAGGWDWSSELLCSTTWW